MPSVQDRLNVALAHRYRVEQELGQGGMATVYLAQDLRHDRKVAIKVLRPELAAVIGAERFLREIKTIASLQHSHILGLIDSGEVEGTAFYVMPFVEGESLRDRLAREKQLPIADTIRIASEVASALDYAHRHGVIHRDIKPENILLHDGQALVADFGIALAVSSAAGTRMTETGMSLGTPHYMSPEQAMGERDITARSDVYALGAMTYEMLVGDPPFTGPSAQAIVAKVVTEKPVPPSVSRDTVPASVEEAVLTALAKLPADRYATAAEFAAALTGPSSGTSGARPAAGRAPIRAGSAWPFRAAVAVALVAIVCAAWFAARAAREPAAPVSRFVLNLPNLRSGDVFYRGNAFALSPDGSRLAYVGIGASGAVQLWVRDRDELTPHALAGTDGADGPFFSPDGRWIGYFAYGSLYKIPAEGGTAIPLADSSSSNLIPSGTWLPDGRILFNGARFDLREISDAGGPVRVLEEANQRMGLGTVFPTALPRKDAILITECTNNCARMNILALNLKTHEQDTLLASTARAWYLPGDRLIAVRQDGTLIGATFDPRSLRLTGTPVPLLAGIRMELGVSPELAVGGDGTLVYLPADSGGSDVTVVRVDRRGTAAVLDPAWRANINYVALSPDGRRLAASIVSGDRTDIWVKQLDAGPLTRLTFRGTLNYRPSWGRDGRVLTFTSDQDGPSYLFSVRADGSNRPRRLFEGDTTQIDESFYSPDGQWLVYRAGVTDGARRIYARRIGSDTGRVALVSDGFDAYMPALSPDGKWLAYVSVESGHEEVYVRPFPDAARARWQISTSGGNNPVWSPDGRELFYLTAADSLASVAVAPGPGPDFLAGPRQSLFSVRPFLFAPFHQAFSVTPDGRSFIMLRRVDAGQGSTSSLTVVLNWFQELGTKLKGLRKKD